MAQGGLGDRLAEAASALAFQGLSSRWVVKRIFSWLDQNRKTSKDYERLCETSEVLVYVVMMRLMVRVWLRV